MPDWEEWDLYEILQVHPSAEPEVINAAYRKLQQKYHPDHSVDKVAAEEFTKKLNIAYEVLSDPQRRNDYDLDWLKRTGKPSGGRGTAAVPRPKPVVDPEVIRFKDATPGQPQTASFIIRNDGGDYSEIWVEDPGSRGSWVTVMGYRSTTSDELPLEVVIEAEGQDWGKTYSEYIRVRLDEEETKVGLELKTVPKPPSPPKRSSGAAGFGPIGATAGSSGSAWTVGRRSSLTRLNLAAAVLLLAAIPPVFFVLTCFRYPSIQEDGAPVPDSMWGMPGMWALVVGIAFWIASPAFFAIASHFWDLIRMKPAPASTTDGDDIGVHIVLAVVCAHFVVGVLTIIVTGLLLEGRQTTSTLIEVVLALYPANTISVSSLLVGYPISLARSVTDH